MRVLLINPPYTTTDRYGKDLGRFGPLNEPLGLAYLAASLEQAGHQVTILDAPAEGMSVEGVCEVAEEGGYGLVGVTMLTPMYSRSIEVIEAVKGRLPETKVVVGGAHPTILPGETLAENGTIDFAVIGEGETVLRDLADTLENGGSLGHVPGLAYRQGADVHINPPPTPVKDLDDLPKPARHLLPMQAYRMTRSRTKAEHAFTVSVARGCPFDCAFCCRIFGRRIRHHSVERLIEEVGILVDDYGAKEINLEADTLTLDRGFVHTLCEGLVESGLAERMAWTCESRVDTVDAEMLKTMKAAGCWQISYGVETGSQRLLGLIQKGISIDRIEKTFSLTKEVGISIRAFFMLGLPTETRAESLKTVALAKRLDARWSQFTLFTPFPGTALYDTAVREGGLRSENWSDFKTHGGWTKGDLAYVPRGRSPEEMKQMQRRAYRAVYMRPKVFFRFVRDVDSSAKIIEYALGLWVLLKTLLPGGNRIRVPRIAKEDLRRFAEGVYVDSPVYFTRNPLVRALNWRKLDRAASLLLGEGSDRILDLCCGNGIMLPFLSERYRKVVGLDRHTRAAQRMRTKLHFEGVSLTAADGMRLPFRDGTFYGILALSALEHFEDLEGIVKEMARVIRPGGFVLYLAPTENRFYRLGRWLCGYVKPQDHHHSGSEVEEALQRHFDPEILRSLPTFLPPCLAVYRLGRLRKSDGSIRVMPRERARHERSGEREQLSFA
jgi:radical SAM superfamily enzyme YgiQ (UPF0313 family)/ubiquinone/menaquinone biosynthesis C-methylase UbiE